MAAHDCFVDWNYKHKERGLINLFFADYESAPSWQIKRCFLVVGYFTKNALKEKIFIPRDKL